jgi:hypothetical protein
VNFSRTPPTNSRERPFHQSQPGAPDSPVHHRTLSGADFFPILAQPTVEGLEPLAHWTLSGAHRTVRCPLQTVGPATRHTRIAQPTVGSPDSPVNFSCTPPTNSRKRPFHQSQPGAPDTVQCTPDSPVPPSDRWPGHASRADCATDHWLDRPLAHRTVR